MWIMTKLHLQESQSQGISAFDRTAEIKSDFFREAIDERFLCGGQGCQNNFYLFFIIKENQIKKFAIQNIWTQ